MKLCVDCEWFVKGGRCTNATPTKDYTGEGMHDDWRGSARLQREDGFFDSLIMGTCGKRARFFKKKAETTD